MSLSQIDKVFEAVSTSLNELTGFPMKEAFDEPRLTGVISQLANNLEILVRLFSVKFSSICNYAIPVFVSNRKRRWPSCPVITNSCTIR
jgi:hypothetical protein